jgi:hypothetical protein
VALTPSYHLLVLQMATETTQEGHRTNSPPNRGSSRRLVLGSSFTFQFIDTGTLVCLREPVRRQDSVPGRSAMSVEEGEDEMVAEAPCLSLPGWDILPCQQHSSV